MAIVSSKRTVQVERVLEHLQCRSYFDEVLGAQDVENHKPHPEGVQTTFRRLGIKASDAVVVGDSTYDLDMAKNAGVDCIGVTTGVHTRQTLSATNPTFIVQKLKEILPIVSNRTTGKDQNAGRVVTSDLNTS